MLTPIFSHATRLLALLTFATFVTAADDPTLPRVHADWKVEVVAQTPQLKFPTVVACAPDGRVFVGENPIDMTGPPDQPIDRILCLHPDGKITVFAEKLGCVFGLLYLDGKLYVNHCPKFSVFRDDHSIGKDRVDWFDFKSPRPPLTVLTGSRAHIPGNLRVGMDGWIYLAVGDVGLPDVAGPDGKRVTLHSGGIVRFRPDGKGLEIFSSGTRNHPDLAINAEDEIFTYDNTDDGNGWWTRVTHMVDGGYYGYPWDYKPRQPHTLWMMTDYGSGSGCGSIAYNEDALPSSYHGNLFLVDYARQQTLRLRVDRQGSSYHVVNREQPGGLDWMTIGQGDFRPFGIDLAPDGMTFYVTDWQTHLANVKMDIGRLLKVTYTGPSNATKKPAWWVAAAQGEKFTASTEELLQALSHPAQSVRLVAQRRLAARGAEIAEPLKKLFSDPKAAPAARWSALWALDALDEGRAARAEIIAALKDRDDSVRRQAVRQLGTRGVKEAAGPLSGLLKDSEASVRFQAATALGRIGDRSAVPALQAALTEKSLFARYATFTALNRIGRADATAWKDIVAGLKSKQPEVVEGSLFAVRETFETPVVKALAELVLDAGNEPEARAKVVPLLAAVARKEPAWDGHWWGDDVPAQPVQTPRPARTQDWEGTGTALSAIRSLLKDPRPAVRSAALTAVEETRDQGSTAILRELFRAEANPQAAVPFLIALGQIGGDDFIAVLGELIQQGDLGLVAEGERARALSQVAVAAAERSGGPAIESLLNKLLGMERTQDPIVAQVVQALGNLKSTAALPGIAQRVQHKNPQVAAIAVNALAQIGGDVALEKLMPLVKDPRPEIRRAALAGLGKLRSRAAVPTLLAAYGQLETTEAAAAALLEIPDVRAVDVYLATLGGRSQELRASAFKALQTIQEEALPLIEERFGTNPPPPEVIYQLQAVRNAASGGGFLINQWFTLGPFPVNVLVTNPMVQLPLNGQFGSSGGQPVTWRRIGTRPLTGRVDFTSAFGLAAGATNVAAFLTLPMGLPAKQQSHLVVSGETPVTVWLNGVKIHDDAGVVPARPRKVAADFEMGNNMVTFRVDQMQSAKKFAVSVSNPIGVTEPAPSNADPKAYAAFSLARVGDAARGRDIFTDPKGVNCVRCHRIDGSGGELGPALIGIGAKYRRAQLIEAVLYPSKQILQGYQQTMIKTKDGEILTGLVRKETADSIVLADANGKDQTIAKSQIELRKPSDVSIMPEGLQLGMPIQDFTDLISFLETLR